ncbi:MAG TPA: hypothetical protein VGE29_09375 [Prosthecobacter sp.]
MKILPKIDSPCPQSWETMTGSAKCRFCSQCQLHVHNLAAMTEAEQQELLASRLAKGERACIAYVEPQAQGTSATPPAIHVRSRTWLALQRLPRPLRHAATWLLFGLTAALTSCSTGSRQPPSLGPVMPPPEGPPKPKRPAAATVTAPAPASASPSVLAHPPERPQTATATATGSPKPPVPLSGKIALGIIFSEPPPPLWRRIFFFWKDH